MANLGEAISNFSKKFKAFNNSSQQERVVQPTENEKLQQQIRERDERLRMSVVSTYRIYKSPFEVLGKNSDRAVSMDKDEQALLKAANLYKAVMDINQAANAEEEVAVTFINKIEIASPLTQKASYTTGGQFVYLMCWLYFEQNFREYIPTFLEKNTTTSLIFIKAENYEFESHDKEIFRIVEEEFYR